MSVHLHEIPETLPEARFYPARHVPTMNPTAPQYQGVKRHEEDGEGSKYLSIARSYAVGFISSGVRVDKIIKVDKSGWEVLGVEESAYSAETRCSAEWGTW